MKKYLSLFEISLKQEFAYRTNFIMWRIRNVINILLIYFLWDSVFTDPGRVIFGYDRTKMLTYVFAVIVIRATVFATRSVDVPSEISSGNLSNYLVKPIGFFKYWLTRDLSSKLLNTVFSIVEFVILYILLKPNIFIQTEILHLLLFFIMLLIAIFMYFSLLFITSSLSLWVPEASWGVQFLLHVIIIDFLSGAIFPIDVLPPAVQKIMSYTPFPYFIYYPIQAYLGRLNVGELFFGIGMSMLWLFMLLYLMKIVWKRGLISYGAYGK